MHHEINDSVREGSLPRWLVAANVAGALAAAGASVVGLIRPAFVLAGSAATPLAEIYTQVYAARALPLGAALVVVLLSRRRAGLRMLLVVSGLAHPAWSSAVPCSRPCTSDRSSGCPAVARKSLYHKASEGHPRLHVHHAPDARMRRRPQHGAGRGAVARVRLRRRGRALRRRGHLGAHRLRGRPPAVGPYRRHRQGARRRAAAARGRPPAALRRRRRPA